jgi:hypothetical protein
MAYWCRSLSDLSAACFNDVRARQGNSSQSAHAEGATSDAARSSLRVGRPVCD